MVSMRGIDLGIDAWTRRVGSTYGVDIWNCCMDSMCGSMHGFDAWIGSKCGSDVRKRLENTLVDRMRGSMC